MRPVYHFTPKQNFMNDPNGLVFCDGEYHLFYQHNPFGDTWGHMSWGHAVSRDLLRWEHLPLALAERAGEMVFSGSAVVDHANTSGLGHAGRPPLVAIYTGHTEREQTQNLAWSTDRGRTWTRHAGNPVLAIGSRQHRDPKVFWFEPTRRWVMVTVLADEHRVRFDTSPDLSSWTRTSEFGPAGATDGAWECPDLFPLPVDGEPETVRWVLKVDVQRGIGAQYFVGEFDGEHFHPDGSVDRVLRVDHGADFYAAQSWSDAPDGRRLWLAWMSHWDYASSTPTSPWRGMFSIPRELRLLRSPDGVRLVQAPAAELRSLRRPLFHFAGAGASLAEINAALSRTPMSAALEIDVELALGGATEFGLQVRKGAEAATTIGVDARCAELFVDRRRSGDVSFAKSFAAEHRAPLALEQGRVRLQIFVDACSVEVFADGGRSVISDLIFPGPQSRGVELYARGGEATLEFLDVFGL
jgi:fructan beta-fructosidase